jgi:DNA-binding SARP family transcriptional activator
MTIQNLELPFRPKPSMLRATMTYGGGRGGRAVHWLLGDLTLPVPRSLSEFLLWPFYALVLFWAMFLALTASGPTVPALIGSAVVIGLVGLAYPSRRIVAGAVLLLWWSVVLIGPAIDGLRIWMALVALVLTGLYVRYVDKVERQRDREFHARQAAREHARHGRSMVAFLPGPLETLSGDVPLTLPGVTGTRKVDRLKVVELNRHFDSQVEASINGTLHEFTRGKGWNIGIGFGPFGLSRSMSQGFGDGVLNLGLRGTMQEDWAHENFVAVFETHTGGQTDVFRLVVPSDPAVHEYVQNLLWSWQRDLGVDSAAELLVRRALYDLPGRVVSDASYVADRLTSILHMEPSARPEVSVVGTAMGEHALLGGAIQFGRDGRWYQLFPVSLVSALVDLMNGRVPPPAPKLEAPSEALVELPASHAGAPVPDSSNGQAASALHIATVGHLSIQVGDADQTTELVAKPVASLVWLYLLARAIRNPRDVISRAALADEVFPGLDPKQQRTRLRQRLSDFQASVSGPLANCLVLDGERVRFNLDGATIDAVQLRSSASAAANSNGALDEPQLKDLESLASSVGDGMFLPDWEALEQKVTSGRSGAGGVIEEARAEVDRWRTQVLIAIADSYGARSRPGTAIPYLERVVRGHPENELATKKLVAAYLETGQTDRAAELQKGTLAPR